jgi:DNA-binding PadR family transcriptional regulator
MMHEGWSPFWKAFAMGRHFGRGRWHRGGFGGGWGAWRGAWSAGRMRRGDMKYRILEVIAERPRHGYDIIRDLEQRHDGYRPSAGSVYPTLQMLEDGGFVTSETVDGKRVYTITDLGRKLLAERTPDEDDDSDGDERGPWIDLRMSAFKLAAAVMQSARESDPGTLARIREILDKARREIYAILAGGS